MKALELTWLGQSTTLVRMGADIVVIDVFFTDYPLRTYAAPTPDLLPADVSTFLCSHMHGDHFDAPALRQIAATRTIEIVVPEVAVDKAKAEVPAASIRGIANDQVLKVGSMTIRGVGVVHGDEPKDGYVGGPYLGFLIDAPFYPTFFHAGDCIPSAGLRSALQRYRPAIMALPINGRDWYREEKGFVGNMSAEEAAITAIDAGAELVIPLHYDAVEGNGADPADLVRHVRARDGAVTVMVPARNKAVLIGGSV